MRTWKIFKANGEWVWVEAETFHDAMRLAKRYDPKFIGGYEVREG